MLSLLAGETMSRLIFKIDDIVSSCKYMDMQMLTTAIYITTAELGRTI